MPKSASKPLGARPIDQRWFDYDEAEHTFGIKRRTLRYYSRELRVLPSYTIGRKVRFLGKDLREFFGTMREDPIDLDAS